MSPEASKSQRAAELYEEVVDALAQVDRSALGEELAKSLGDIVGMDKDDSLGAPFLVRDEDGEFVTIYNSYTGLPSRVTVPMLKKLMERKFGPQHVEVPREWYGKRVWTVRNPQVDRPAGLPCIFNPESSQYADVKAAGLGHIQCRKSNLANPNEVRLHAEHKHASFKAFQAYMDEKRRTEDRDSNRAMLEAIMALAQSKEK